MSSKLYKATVSVDVVFLAEDDAHAERIASDMAKEEVQDAGVFCVESCEPINTVSDVPGEWLDCLPRAETYSRRSYFAGGHASSVKEQTVAKWLGGAK